MPITPDQMSYEEMEKVAKNPYYKCGECGGRLNLAWGGSLDWEGYILRCGIDVSHNTITKYNKKREEFMSEVRETSEQSSTALMAMTETQMVERVDTAKFVKDLTVPEKRLLAAACITYGFDPIMHELTIFQGNPFVSVDGRYRKAQETGRLDGVETRPATQDEKTAWGIPEGDYFLRAEVYVKGSSRPFVGWGRVRKVETQGKEFLPVVNNPQRMAEKRAEAQALRKAFHIPLPSAEYIGVPEDAYPVVKVEGVGQVDKGTGEIMEAEVIESEPQPEPTESKSSPRKPKENSERQFKNAGEFMTACNEEFNMAFETVASFFGVADLSEIKDLSAAWQQLCKVYN